MFAVFTPFSSAKGYLKTSGVNSVPRGIIVKCLSNGLASTRGPCSTAHA